MTSIKQKKNKKAQKSDKINDEQIVIDEEIVIVKKADKIGKEDEKVDDIKFEDEKAENKNFDEEEDLKVGNKKDKKKSNTKKQSLKRQKLDEEEDFFKEIQDILKNADYDKKNLEQKIDLAWLDVKTNFVNLIRQKNMYNKISLLFNKGSQSTKYDIIKATLKNVVEVSSHEHSRQFIISLAKDHKKTLVLFINRLKEVAREIVCNRNGIYVLDEIYKMSNRKCRSEIVLSILDLEELSEEEYTECCDHEDDGCCDLEDESNDDGEEHIGCCDNDNEEEESNDEEEKVEDDQIVNEINEEDDSVDDQTRLRFENMALIKKLSSKRLWKYEVSHHLLLEFITIYPLEAPFLLDLFIRNKQINLLLQTYKGLEVSLSLLNDITVKEIVRLITPDFINIVNNEYGVIYILRILEYNQDNNTIIDLYTEKYKDIFINEVSVLPLVYIFNQERKYYPTLFNQLRSKEIINIDKGYLLSKFKEIIIKHMSVFTKSFVWILVYFFCKKDDEIKKLTIKVLKDCEMNEYSEKLKKKMIKYKLMK